MVLLVLILSVSRACRLQLYSACFAWALHWLVARLLLKGMNVPGVAWSELLAYTGYPFVLICFTTLGGFLAGVLGGLPSAAALLTWHHTVLQRTCTCQCGVVPAALLLWCQRGQAKGHEQALPSPQAEHVLRCVCREVGLLRTWGLRELGHGHIHGQDHETSHLPGNTGIR